MTESNLHQFKVGTNQASPCLTAESEEPKWVTDGLDAGLSGDERFVTEWPSWLDHPALEQPLRDVRERLEHSFDDPDPALHKASEPMSTFQSDQSPVGEPVGLRARQHVERVAYWRHHKMLFIDNEEFGQADAASKIFAIDLELALPTEDTEHQQSRSGSSTRASLPSGTLGAMCSAELLTAQQERELFRRMNFLMCQARRVRDQVFALGVTLEGLNLLETLFALAQWHRDRIVEANIRLVIATVKKLTTPTNSFDELLSDGIEGLVRAVEKFDYDRGFRFSTYATLVIRRNAYRVLMASQQERQRTVGDVQDMELSSDQYAPQSSMGEKRWAQLRQHLFQFLDRLDRREKLIIRSRFALGSHRQVRTLQALADRLGISKERVRQLEQRAITKLKSMADGVELSDLDA